MLLPSYLEVHIFTNSTYHDALKNVFDPMETTGKDALWRFVVLISKLDFVHKAGMINRDADKRVRLDTGTKIPRNQTMT